LSANVFLIGGFFNRLEASRKYIFGAASVYGTANNSIIRGAFFIRGREALPALVEDMWAWDKPIEANGKTYDWADGKVFK
jgi:elongation factor 1-gamma